MNEPWISVAQAADYSGHHSKTVLTALRRGHLQGVQASPGQTWRTRESYVDAWLAGKAKVRRLGAVRGAA